ncbi:pentatricopeptide repeat (PPR) superfamily protein [Actinidia rufa]|uniref:Pentatricopeptide repeat (PPR) superfamily protein n=1 Tax=Actinidia rufa TaxID=165716 RepID=A0A7J0GA77_9ERIC|nr:pentatricopeptide repeat (PPR) superfamily protein [Actinidia rufa]
MIRGHAQSETPCKAIELYNHMEAERAVTNGFTYSFVISACARSGLLREGEQMHSKVIANGFCSNLFVQTNLVNLYAMGGRSVGVGNARQVFGEMSERNVVTWNSLLAGYVRNRDIDMAYGIFNEMPERNVVSWTTMIAGCAQNGRCKKALALFGEMQRVNIELDQVVLVAVLSACAELGDLKLGRIHKNAELAAHVAQKLTVELDPDRAAGYLVLLSNVYATTKRWQDASVVRRKMVEMGVKKPPGRSWVEIDGVIHDFVAGDWSPIHGYSIYKVLGEILAQAKSEGYKADILEQLIED